VDVDIDHTPSGTYAGDPSPVTRPGELLANWGEDNLDRPVSRCLLETFKEQVSKDMSRKYDPDGPNLTPEQRKKEAQGLLRQGICDAKYFGPNFCQKHKTFTMTGGQIQNPQPEKTTLFEELQDLGKMNFGNPVDHMDKTPIDFSRLPKASPDAPASKTIVLPGL
jgi:hypothetical protein